MQYYTQWNLVNARSQAIVRHVTKFISEVFFTMSEISNIPGNFKEHIILSSTKSSSLTWLSRLRFTDISIHRLVPLIYWLGWIIIMDLLCQMKHSWENRDWRSTLLFRSCNTVMMVWYRTEFRRGYDFVFHFFHNFIQQRRSHTLWLHLFELTNTPRSEYLKFSTVKIAV